ncbi:MAG: MmcQ/YjbR family DNA-binding protein [Bryobacteraceae bacterium]|jgi:predicted DNA-binding protein (MmcQ/YjbR family)
MITRLRKICLTLSNVEEKKIFDHPTFRVGGKMFCLYHGTTDAPAIAVKVGKMEQGIFLADSRFFRTPYIGHQGWVSLPAIGRLDWKEITELVKGSYALVASDLKAPRKTKRSKS